MRIGRIAYITMFGLNFQSSNFEAHFVHFSVRMCFSVALSCLSASCVHKFLISYLISLLHGSLDVAHILLDPHGHDTTLIWYILDR